MDETSTTDMMMAGKAEIGLHDEDNAATVIAADSNFSRGNYRDGQKPVPRLREPASRLSLTMVRAHATLGPSLWPSLLSEGTFLVEYEKDYIKIFVFRCGEAIMAAVALSESGVGKEGGEEQKN